MSDQEEFDRILEIVATYVEGIGDEVLEENVEEIASGHIRGQDYSLTGHHCEGDDNSTYIVGGHPDLRFFTVLYIFSLERHVGSRLPDEQVESLTDEVDDDELGGDEEWRRTQRAGKILLERLPQAEMDALKSYTFMFVSRGDNSTFTQTDEGGIIESLTVANAIFPYEEDFTIREFYDAVQSTVSAGRRGHELLERTLFVDIDEEDPSNTKLDLNFGW